jgi:hypothetical protein
MKLYLRRKNRTGLFRKVADLDRRFIPMRLFRGCAIEALKRFEDAAREFEEAIRLSERGDAFPSGQPPRSRGRARDSRGLAPIPAAYFFGFSNSALYWP